MHSIFLFILFIEISYYSATWEQNIKSFLHMYMYGQVFKNLVMHDY